MSQMEKFLSNVEDNHNITREQAEFIIKNFWLAFKEYTDKPDECYTGISLPYFSFMLNPFKIEKFIRHLEDNPSRTKRSAISKIEKLNTLNKTLKNLNERHT